MTDARAEILRRVEAALGGQSPPAPAPRRYARASEDGRDPVALFAERVGDYQAIVEVVTDSELPAAITAALAAVGARRIAVPADLPHKWLSAADAEPLVDDPAAPIIDLDRVDAVVTGVALGIAVTGTIVLDAGFAQGRRALTLLPDFHLCVVRADQIVTTVPEAIARLSAGRPQTWISGPSATSDIELNRVEGVHGPRRLHVVVLRSP